MVSNKHVNANENECEISKIRMDGITGNAPFTNTTKSIDAESVRSMPKLLDDRWQV
jgi:hypothetical protein